MEFTAIAWNLFHGRDFPPDPQLRSWRSRLLRIDERNETHVQVNRDLTTEFATLLAATAWDVALLQECPPRFAAPLARACAAESHRALTSRNSLGPLRGLLARQNPDLIASGEGGSNLTLVRVPGRLGGIAERRELAIHDGPPERRAMALTRTASGVCVANLHATNDQPDLASEDVLRGRPRRARVRRRGAAGLRRRPQPAPGRGPRRLRSAARGLRPDRDDRAAGDRPPADPRPRGARPAGPLAAGATRAAARRTRPAALRPRPGAGTIRRGGAT